MPIKSPPPVFASAPSTPHPGSASKPFAALLAPFTDLPDDKREVLREILQIYVSKDSGKHTELEKRKRLTASINRYVKGKDEEDGDV
jgi:hypothetical protein